MEPVHQPEERTTRKHAPSQFVPKIWIRVQVDEGRAVTVVTLWTTEYRQEAPPER